MNPGERDPLQPTDASMEASSMAGATDAHLAGGVGGPTADAAPVMPSPEEIAQLAADARAAVPLSMPFGPGGTEETDGAPASAADTPSRRTRRVLLKNIVFRFATLILTIAMLGAGVAAGYAVFLRVQPPPPVVGDIATAGVAAPAVVKELADALATNNADALRSSMDAGPYQLLAGEMQGWSMQGVTSVKTLATMQDGSRSATEIVIIGRNTEGNPLVFNLVVQVDNNQIVSFR
jgi:hypothetical protein